ncbi:hypothetical protein WOA01_13235 [Methylocystis sp. IM2]|uniref:hypothetical protein n=1 Tax=Methylocystis sp. IM2 TaxID=3136563 RepID=UPI0030F6667B
MRRQKLSRRSLDESDGLARPRHVRRIDRAGDDQKVEVVVERQPVRVLDEGPGRLARLWLRGGDDGERPIGRRVAHDHIARAHAAQKPAPPVRREDHVFSHLAVRNSDDLGVFREAGDIEDRDGAAPERGDISLCLVVVEIDVMGDKIRRQRGVLHDLVEAGRRGVDVDDGDSLSPGRDPRLALIIERGEQFRSGGRTRRGGQARQAKEQGGGILHGLLL